MQILLFFYLILTLIVSGQMLFDGMIWGGVALLVGSLLGFAGGSGMRGAFYQGQRTSAVLIGIALVIGGMALVYYRGITVGLFGWSLPADLWVLAGFGLGFFAARPEDAGVRPDVYAAADDVTLGTIAPIAAELAAGRLTPEQADKHIQESAFIAPDAPTVWGSMNANERDELGVNFMRLAANPEFSARIEKWFEPMKEADPQLWNDSLAKAKRELGTSPDKSDS